jgi:MFS transporter, DHA2 family, multidrug resistance protein
MLLTLPFRLQGSGYGPMQIGAVTMPYAIAVGIASPIAGMLSDHSAPGVPGTVGLGAVLAGVIALGILAGHPATSDVAWRRATGGVGFGLFFSPNACLIVGSVPAGRASLVATTRMIGQAFGSTLLGIVLSVGSAAAGSATFVSAGLVLIALACSAARLRLA